MVRAAESNTALRARAFVTTGEKKKLSKVQTLSKSSEKCNESFFSVI